MVRLDISTIETEGHTQKSTWSVNGGMAHDDQWQTRYSDTENFFPNQNYNYTTSSTYNRKHILSPSVEANIRWAYNAKNTFHIKAKAEMNKTRDVSEYHLAQFSDNPYLLFNDPLYAAFDTISAHSVIMRNHNQQNSELTQSTVDAQAEWTRYITKGSVAVLAALSYRDVEMNEWTNRNIEYATENLLPNNISQYSLTPTTNFNSTFQVQARRWIGDRVLLNLTYKFGYNNKNSSCEFETNGSHDAMNSYNEQYKWIENNIQLSSTINLNSLQLIPQITWLSKREKEQYLRGMVDTVAVRNAMWLTPQLKAVYKLTKTSKLELNYSLRTSKPRLLSTLPFYDNSNPLYIRQGNAGLKDSHTNNLSFNYNLAQARHQRTLSITGSYTFTDRSIQGVLTYDPLTAVYKSRPENIRGASYARLSISYGQALWNNIRLQNNMELNCGRSYGSLTAIEGVTKNTQNRQDSFTPTEKLIISYDNVWLQCSAFMTIQMNHLRMTESSLQNATLWNNQFGASVTIKHGHFEFFTTLTEFIRRGYITKNRNRSFLIWNARISYSFLKKKASLALYFNDILNNFDNFSSQQTTYQNTYTWSGVMHHYANITFRYHFDAKK